MPFKPDFQRTGLEPGVAQLAQLSLYIAFLRCAGLLLFPFFTCCGHKSVLIGHAHPIAIGHLLKKNVNSYLPDSRFLCERPFKLMVVVAIDFGSRLDGRHHDILQIKEYAPVLNSVHTVTFKLTVIIKITESVAVIEGLAS